MQKSEYSLIFTPTADRDLAQIAEDYIILGSVSGANRILNKILDITENIRFMPYIGKLSSNPELEQMGIRIFPVEKYLIVYRISENDKIITVYRVLNGTTNYIDRLKNALAEENP